MLQNQYFSREVAYFRARINFVFKSPYLVNGCKFAINTNFDKICAINLPKQNKTVFQTTALSCTCKQEIVFPLFNPTIHGPDLEQNDYTCEG